MIFSWQEGIGYLASLLVAISLLMSSVKRLRWINMVGSFVFAVYGLVILSIPVLIMNTFLVFVNLWFLIKLKQNKNTRLHLKQEDWSDAFVRKFMCKNHHNVAAHYPEFNYVTNSSELQLIYNEFEIAGFLAGHVKDNRLFIDAVYVLSKYKDFAIHKKLFDGNSLTLRAFNVDNYEFVIKNERTRKYLKRNKFIL